MQVDCEQQLLLTIKSHIYISVFYNVCLIQNGYFLDGLGNAKTD